MPAVKLYYFNATGRALHLRMALAAGGVDFEDVVPAAMPPPEETVKKWKELTAGHTTFSVPIMTVDEGTDKQKVYVQSSAILRVAGRMGDLKMTLADGDADDVAYLTDRAIADADDLRSAAYRGFTGGYFSGTQEAADKYATKIFPKHIATLEKQFLAAGGDYWGGSSTLSLADVTLFEAIEFFGVRILEGSGHPDPVGPDLRAWLDRVASHEHVKAYLKGDKFKSLAFKFTKSMIGK